MDLEHLTHHVTQGGIDYTIVRPGITLCLLYSEPVVTLAPAIAHIFEEYIAFIPDGALQSYLSSDGTWKKATKRTFNSTLKDLNSMSPGEYSDFYFGQVPLANVGKYGAHFKGSPLDNDFYPLENCVLYLEFPVNLSEFTNIEEFVKFVQKVAFFHEFDSGYCGYSFNHLNMTFRRDAFKAIGKMAMRYIGFDVCNDMIRLVARERICNISWFTLFGNRITAKLGGIDEIRRNNPDVLDVLEFGSSTMIKASIMPIVGDVNRGAKDTVALRRLSKFTRDLRVETENLGPDDPDFAERWLSRFDT